MADDLSDKLRSALLAPQGRGCPKCSLHREPRHHLGRGPLVSVEGKPATEVRSGEIVPLPRNDTHVLASEHGLTPADGRHLVYAVCAKSEPVECPEPYSGRRSRQRPLPIRLCFADLAIASRRALHGKHFAAAAER